MDVSDRNAKAIQQAAADAAARHDAEVATLNLGPARHGKSLAAAIQAERDRLADLIEANDPGFDCCCHGYLADFVRSAGG